MKIVLDKRFKKNLAGKFGKYSFEVGILEDGPHRDAKREKRGLKGADVLTQYAGGPARKMSNKNSGGKLISDVSHDNTVRLGFSYLVKPFEGGSRKNADILAFSNEFFRFAFGHTQKKRAENLLQAIVRNPILRGDYGKNSRLAQKIKGFDRFMIDTAQMFKAIKARVNVKGGA